MGRRFGEVNNHLGFTGFMRTRSKNALKKPDVVSFQSEEIDPERVALRGVTDYLQEKKIADNITLETVSLIITRVKTELIAQITDKKYTDPVQADEIIGRTVDEILHAITSNSDDKNRLMDAIEVRNSLLVDLKGGLVNDSAQDVADAQQIIDDLRYLGVPLTIKVSKEDWENAQKTGMLSTSLNIGGRLAGEIGDEFSKNPDRIKLQVMSTEIRVQPKFKHSKEDGTNSCTGFVTFYDESIPLNILKEVKN